VGVDVVRASLGLLCLNGSCFCCDGQKRVLELVWEDGDENP